MQTIAVINKKGGTGKTTTAVNLGVALSRLGKRVLMIDFDPQGNLSYYLGIHKVNYDIANALFGEVSLQETVVRREGIDVIPATPDLAKVEAALANFYRKEEVFRSLLAEVKGYDYAIIDCSPGGYILQRNALTAANWVLVPMQLEVLNIKGLLQITEEVREVKNLHNPDLKFLGTLPIAYDRRRRGFSKSLKFQNKLREHMEGDLKVKFMRSSIRNDLKVKEAPGHGKSVIRFAPNSSGAEDYMDLAREVMERAKVKVLQPVHG